jgi:hypothetical protein
MGKQNLFPKPPQRILKDQPLTITKIPKKQYSNKNQEIIKRQQAVKLKRLKHSKEIIFIPKKREEKKIS